MTYRRDLWDLAVPDQRGFVTTADAVALGIPPGELAKLAARGGLERWAYGLYRFTDAPNDPCDAYLGAVLAAGPDAHLHGRSVLAMHGLEFVNPTIITVASPRRVRRNVEGVEILRVEVPTQDLTNYGGIPSTTVARALRDCAPLLIDERLEQAVRDARARGLLTSEDAYDSPAGATRQAVEHASARPRRTAAPRSDEFAALAALVRSPRGLPSAQAVACAAGLATDAATAAIARLTDQGLVVRREEPRLIGGHSQRVSMIYADLDHPVVRERLGELNAATRPAPVAQRTPEHLPVNLAHLFWNADLDRIVPTRDAALIAHRAITSNDAEGLAWAVTHLPVSAFEEAARYRGAPPDAAVWARTAATLAGATR